MRLIKYLFLLIMVSTITSATAQYTTKHYIAPSPWSYFSRYNELVITTLSTTPVAVTVASSNGTIYTNSATTVAGTPLRYRFTATDAKANLSGVVLTGQGLYVSASVPIGVQVRNIASDNYTYSGLGPGDLTSCIQKGNSAFTSLGDQGLGTSFRLGYYANVTGQTCYTGETGAPLYSVLAINNNTNVYVNGSLLKTLQAGQSYLFQASIGSLVTSNNNIVVNTGMRGDNSSGCADGVESQVIPTANLGTTYVIVRSKGNTGYEKSTIVATQASTVVTVRTPSTNTTNTYTLSNAGDFVTINNGDGSNAYTTNYITSTSPVAVYTGSADGCEIDMIVQPPLSSCSGSFDVQTNRFLSNANDGNAVLPYFGYIVIQSDTAIVYFNGTNLESIVGNRTQIGTSGYYIIKYTSTQLGNPSNLRFVVNARINAALIESGAGYSMSAFISSISNAMPPPAASSSCLPTTFTAQGGFSSYQWYKDGVLISGATSQTYTPSVAGSFSVTGTTVACGTTAQSTAVLVNPKPEAGSDMVVCAGQIDTLTATSTISGGSWIALPTNPTGATLSNTADNVSTVTFSNASSGTYKFAFSVGCSDTMSILVNPLPTIAAITGTTSICIGSTTTLASATSGGVWSSSLPSVATINSNGVVTSVSVGTSVISYTVTNTNGCRNTVETTVTVNALPTLAAITGITSTCVGSTTTLNNTTSGGVWSSSNTSVATVNSSGVVTGVSAGTSVITYTVTNANGCVNAVNTTISINALPVVPAITGNVSVCVGSTTTLSNTTTGGVWSSSNTSIATVNTSGVVSGVNNGTSVIAYTVTNANGCTTSVNVIVTVNALPSVASISGTNSVCAGATTTFTNTTVGGVWSSGTPSVATINTSGVITGVSAGNSVITYTYTNANGCSNSRTRTVTVNAQPSVAAITGTNNTCLGSGTTTLSNTTSSGTWSSSVTSVATISSSGVVTSIAAGTTTISYTVNGSGGCSTIQTLLFTVKAKSSSTTNASICAGGSYTFNGTVYTTAGTYTKTLTNAVGCDSVATLNLTVKATSTSTTNTSICPSALPYSWNGLTLNTAGTYTKTLVNAVGCDSIVTLNLTVKATSTSTTNTSICPSGLPYTWNGLTLSAAGTYTKTLVNAVGCDSIATLNLTVKATSASITNTSICPSALPYTWNGLTLTAAGTYTKTLVNAVGCDSVATLNLTVKATSASTTNASICAGGSYTFNGTVYTTAGTYTKTLVNAAGCDSIATLNFTVKATSTSTTNTSICPSALPYSWNGLTLTAAGTYTKTLVNAVGCDSIATLNLTVKATSASTTNASICAGGSYTFNGTVYTTAGTYTKTLTNTVGCDSVATLNLTVKATSASTTNTSICPSALPYSWNGLTLTAAGTYTKTLTNVVGCDSVATLVLTVNPTTSSTTTASICSGNTYVFNGMSFTTTGTYSVRLTNRFGCDSVARLRLIVKPILSSTTNASICAGGSYTFNGTVYTTAGTYTKTLVNAVGCDSIATLNLTVKATSASIINASICPSALPYSWNGLTLTAAGTYTKTLVNALGCDSVATLNLTVKATSASTTNTSICPSALPYSWNGLTLNAAGTYTKTLTNAAGCDSIATLNLTVKATSASTANTSICPSALPYSWNGLTLNAAGTYTKTLTNAVGCDSVATLDLTVKATSTSTTTAILCAGNTYTFNGITYNTPGTYVAHLTNYVGCDSAATLVLVGGAATASTTTMSICPSALPYVWNGLTFTGAGSQTAHLINASGCDSAATLVLTVKAALTSTTNATICGGNSYLFNGVTYTSSGTYNAYLASDLGCDSIATLVLTVLPKPNAGVDKIVGYNNGNASITLSGVGVGVWLANATNVGSSVIVDAANASTEVKNFSAIGTYEYLYINGACSDTMKVSVLPNGNISSYVWVDTNEDGINNESTTNGINNVVIELYKEDTNGNYVLTQTTTTATYNGKPGYYNFVIPENGNYKVKFPLVAQDGALTTQNLSTNTNNNSVADPATGFSPVITINTTGSGSSLNNTAIGAGYKYVASPNCNMTANIGVNQLSQCVTNNQYQFTGNFTGGTAPFTYLWDLNDGNYAYTKDVTHTYATSGEHDVTFIVKDSRGCEAHASTVQIAVGAKPKASFDIYTRTGNGDGFTFVSTSTISGGWMNYSWNLGNGTTSTLINPMTTYSPGIYTVTLVVTGNIGCSDTISKVITVDSSNNYCSGPLANFSVNNIAQCLSGNSFVFANTSTGNNNTYNWNFGDGTAASNNLNEQHTFTNTGTYNITLTATNTCGNNTVTKTVTVNGTPVAPTAITGPTTVALGGVIGLSNATTGGVWSSANTAVATINNYGIVTGITAGNTVITYTIANTCGTTSVDMPITVLAANSNCIAPLANFTINANTQCLVGNNFIFSNSASGTALAYSWKFGDGTTANSANASHTFTQAGVYSVKLIVSNTCGTDSITKTVTINTVPAQPQAITGNNSIATGGTTTLSITTTGGVWSSSNTAIATVSASGLVTGIASGSATIIYTVTNTCGSASVSKIVLVSQACVPTSSTTTASICAGTSYSFNGTTYTTAGTYVAHLTNAAGCDSTATLVLAIKQPTSSTTTASICAGNSYTFNGTAYTTAGTYAAHLTNAAGCDSAATLVLTVKATSASTTNASICAGNSYSFNGTVYTTAGTYVAHLTNAVGCDSTATLVLTVNSLPITLPSISGNTSLSTGTTSLLSNSVTGGTWSSSNTAVATVNANTGLVTGISAGTTVITYTITDACSNIVSTTTNVTVAPAIIACTVQASFSVNNAQQCVTGNQFVFTNTTTGGIAPYTYLWQISEGSTAATKDFTKAFATYGEHDVHLKVIDANGCESNATAKHIVIGAKPVANFSVLSNTGNGTSKTFISASTLAAGNMSYMWNFGNGITSTLVNPTVTYVQGTYTVKLVVSGIGTCKDSVSQVINEVGVATVSVYPNPVVNTVQVSYRAASTTVTTIKLMDLNGRIIQTQTVLPVSVGTNLSAMFDFRNLQPGSYVIHVSDAQNGFLGSKTILKQ